MADNLRKMPKKGILKSSSSFEKPEAYKCSNSKEMKWDEMNIMQTLHPPDKDYGHMKIDEPKTPYTHYKDPDETDRQKGGSDPVSDDEMTDGIDAEDLAKQIEKSQNKLPRAVIDDEDDDDDEDGDKYLNETEEERAKRKLFEQRRKQHYNEFYAITLARKLMEAEGDENEEEDEEDDDDDKNGNDEEECEDESETDENLDAVANDGHYENEKSDGGASRTCSSKSVVAPVHNDSGDIAGK